MSPRTATALQWQGPSSVLPGLPEAWERERKIWYNRPMPLTLEKGNRQTY